jgi:hypothetical protein
MRSGGHKKPCPPYNSHFNPMIHGLVEKVIDWPYSTFHRYVSLGIYSDNWGSGMQESPEHGVGE